MDLAPFSPAQDDMQDMNWFLDQGTLEESMTENSTSSAASSQLVYPSSHQTELSTMQLWAGHSTELNILGLSRAATNLTTDESNGLDSPEPMIVSVERQSPSSSFDHFSQVDRCCGHSERPTRLRNVGDRLHAFSELRRAGGAAVVFPPARWYISSLKSPKVIRTPGVYSACMCLFHF